MAIDESVVRHVARLARLELSDDELRRYRDQLDAILAHIGQLNQLDLAGATPLAHAGDFPNPLRADEPRPSLPVADAVRAAPERAGPYFSVPQVVE